METNINKLQRNRWSSFETNLRTTDGMAQSPQCSHNVFATSYPASVSDLFCITIPTETLTMDGTHLQGALPIVCIIIHKPSITVILMPFHLVSHHSKTMLLFNQDVSFYSHARFYVQGRFYFRDNILPNRPTDFNQWGGPTCWQKLLCSKWHCEERCAVTQRQLLLH